MMQNISNIQSIPANNNLTIQLDSQDWRLLIGDDPIPAVAANAIGLAYSPAFAQARQLSGPLLPAESIESVVVGWAREDTSWHLGVMIVPDAAMERGGRWCGLARWTDSTGQIEATNAETAGRSLAEALGKPLRYVPPSSTYDAAQTADESAIAELPNVQPDSLPITMGAWMLEASPNGLIWKHSKGWERGMLLRGIVYLALALFFLILGIAELKTTFASVQPDWLPYVGFVVAVILAISGLYHLGALLTASVIEVDKPLRMIRFMGRTRGVTKQIPFEKSAFVLVSHAVVTQEKLKDQPADSPYAHVLLECWLHVARDIGDFVEIGHVPSEGRAVRAALPLERHPLNLKQIDTGIHHAARLIGEAIGVSVEVEDRTS